MNDFPIFLLPKGEIMMTAKVDAESIQLLTKTLFPSGKRYAISISGLVACLDKDKKLIIYGQLNLDGGFDYLRILPFPSIISPKSMCLIKDNIILGGENNHDYSNNINSHELIVSYSIIQDKFIPVEMPFQGYDKCVDDFLLQGNNVIAVDNLVYPKYLIEYDFKNPSSPNLIKSHNLPANGTYESIRKGTQNEYYIALISGTFGMYGVGVYINIFTIGNYKDYIRLSQDIGCFQTNVEQKEYCWKDIFLLPNKNFMLIAADIEGIGIYYIDDNLLRQDSNEDSDSIFYFNEWDKKVIKFLRIPNDMDNLIVVFKEGNDNNFQYSYSIKNIDDILERYNENDREYLMNRAEYMESNYQSDDSEYCDACQESPCRCSDRERTSTTHDY